MTVLFDSFPRDRSFLFWSGIITHNSYLLESEPPLVLRTISLALSPTPSLPSIRLIPQGPFDCYCRLSRVFPAVALL